MYIRRKVFSILADEMGNEKLFSVNETILEGFEYDEVDDRYFAEAEEEGNRVLAGAGKGAGITAATLGLGAGAGYGISKGAKAYLKSSEKAKAPLLDKAKKELEVAAKKSKDAKSELKKLKDSGFRVLNSNEVADLKKASAKAKKSAKGIVTDYDTYRQNLKNFRNQEKVLGKELIAKRKVTELSTPSNFNKGISKTRETLQKAAKLIKNNPKTAAAIIAGTTIAGAGVGAAVSSKKNK